MNPQHWFTFLSTSTHQRQSIDTVEGDTANHSQMSNSADTPISGVPQADSETQGRFWSSAKQIGLLGWLLGSAIAFPVLTEAVQSYTLPVRVDRWLEVRQIGGTVDFYRNNLAKAANTYDTRLEQVGDRLTTGDDSSATLAVDTGIGYVTLAENTDLSVQELSITPNGGRVTRLNIVSGQARLQVRPFLNPDSELEIRTPAGVSGVRGTQFSVDVTPKGQTGVMTTEGQVDASAQGVTVLIDAGYQSLIVPGYPPTPPVPITNDVSIDITGIMPIDRNLVRVMGQIDPFSQLVIDNERQDVNAQGWFDVIVPRPDDDRIPVTVSTPLDKEKNYELVVP